MTEGLDGRRHAPTWPELSGSMASAMWGAMSGTMVLSDTDGEARRVVVTYRPPEDIRITYPNGDMVYVGNADAQWTFERPTEPPLFELRRQGQPRTWRHNDVNNFFDLSARVVLDDLWWKAAPDSITPGTKLGRPTWEYALKRGRKTEHVVVDAATGVRLTNRVIGRGWERTIEFVEFTPRSRLSGKQFSWPGPVVPSPVDERLKSLESQNLSFAEREQYAHDLRVPSYWPRGVGMQSSRGNWLAGNFVTVLDLPCRREPPVLVQQPIDEVPYVPEPGRGHVYSWTGDDLRFTLVVESPIGDSDLRKIKESMVARGFF